MKEILYDLRLLRDDLWFYITKPFYRLFRGYDERDLWGLDNYIARRILPGLKAFHKSKKYGYPGDFKSFKEWQNAISEMIYGLEYCLDAKTGGYDRAKKGQELLGKYLMDLWD